MLNDSYLGDGLYASFDGYGITLWTERDFTKHWVYLEPTVYKALQDYVERLKAQAQSAQSEK